MNFGKLGILTDGGGVAAFYRRLGAAHAWLPEPRHLTLATYGAGPEMLVNGDFSDGLDGWSIYPLAEENRAASVVDGKLRMEALVTTTGAGMEARQLPTLEVGKTYQLFGSAGELVSGTAIGTESRKIVYRHPQGNTVTTSAGVGIFTADQTDYRASMWYGAFSGLTEGTVMDHGPMSIREVVQTVAELRDSIGNWDWIQNTASRQPMLSEHNGRPSLLFDGSTQYLRASGTVPPNTDYFGLLISVKVGDLSGSNSKVLWKGGLSTGGGYALLVRVNTAGRLQVFLRPSGLGAAASLEGPIVSMDDELVLWIACDFLTGDAVLNVNGVELDTINIGTSATTDMFGGEIFMGWEFGEHFWSGEIRSSVAWHNSVPTDLAAAENFMMEQSGITP